MKIHFASNGLEKSVSTDKALKKVELEFPRFGGHS